MQPAWWNSRRLLDVALAVAAVLVIAAAARVLVDGPGKPATDALRSAAGPVVTTSALATSSPTPSALPLPPLVILGNAETFGRDGSAGPYAKALAAALGYDEERVVLEGTSFSGRPSFATAITQLPMGGETRLVIIQASAAEATPDATAIQRAAAATIGAARARFGTARLVVIGPLAVRGADPGVTAIAAGLKQGVVGPGVTYIDTLAARWLTASTIPGYLEGKRGPVTPQGAKSLARRVALACGCVAS